MKAAAPVEKENINQQAEHKKKQKQKQIEPLHLRETENANSQTQKPEDQIAAKTTPNANKNRLFDHNGIPAVHGSQPAYAQGAELMYKKLQTSLEQTGDLNHPDTKKSEMDYKMTLGISELRDYHEIKTGTYVAKSATERQYMAEVTKNKAEEATTTKTPNTKETVKTPTSTTQQPAADKSVETQGANTEAPQTAATNPNFVALQGQIKTTAKAQQQHEPASKSSQDAQAAAVSPSNERQSMAQASQVEVMDAQKAGVFSAADFKIQLQKKIESIQLPKDEEAADDFEKNNNIKEVNQNALGDVKQHKNEASNDIATATATKPNAEAQPKRDVAKMPTPNHGKAPGSINVAKAMPSKRDAASIEHPIQAQTSSIDNQMQENGVTDSMLANSNEPSFTSALDEKNKAKTQSQAATNQFRNNENQQLAKTKNEAQSHTSEQIGAMHTSRKGGLDKVHGNQNKTATKDTEKRKEIADKINSIYNASKTEVDTILNALDATVATKFDNGSKAAKKAFEDHVAKNMAAYKKERYGGSWYSWKNLKRVKDAVVGLPKEVNEYFVTGKKEYIKVMDGYITDIANHVATQLNAAKAKINKGKKDVQTYVNSLSPSLRKLGKAAIEEIQSKFSALEENVNSKKDALIDVLAKKYADNVASIDARIEALKAQNSGFINQALGALTGIFAFIIEIKNTLTNLLASVIQVVQAIITDPIGFFKNLIAGIGQGFTNFGTNILKHLQTGFFGWLTGAMQGVSITMPEDVFSIKGIFSISMQVLGIGWEGIRAIGAKVIGEPVMKVLETGVEIVQVIRKDGVAGLWDYLKDQFADLKETVMNTIMDIIQTQVIQAGIKWILGLLSPVGAFVKAVMAIIDVVKFFIQRAAQIAELVKAFIDAVAAIASGKVGAVAASIENALGKAIPVLIGLLASVLGISGLADKVLGVIRKIQKRITDGITKFWNFIKAKGAKLLSKVGVGKKDKKDKKEEKGKVNKGIEWWNDKIAFDNVENATHTLYFKGEGEDAKLYMQSKDDHVMNHLNNAKKVAQTQTEKQSVEAGITHYQNDVLPLNNKLNKLEHDHIKLINDNKDSKNDAKIASNEKTTKEQNKLQDKSLAKLAKLFKAIKFDDNVQPTTVKTNVTSKQDSMGRAQEVEANPLTWMPGNTKGSSPYQNPLGWEHATEDIRNSIYIRGHLLNDNIHGPGASWNLVPITRVMNSNMEAQAENKGKQVLNEKGKHMIMWYKTKVVEYHKPDNNENDKYFPKEIKVEWGHYKDKDGQYDAKGKITDIDSATFEQGKPAMPYNINDLGEKLLVDKLKLNPNFAKAVNEERKKNGWFENINMFEKRMTNYYANRSDKGIFNTGMVEIDNLKYLQQITF